MTSTSRSWAETKDHLLQNPLIWMQYLRESFLNGSAHPTITVHATHSLLWALQCADDDTWRVVWSTAFVSEVARLILRECLCGYTKEQLRSQTGQDPTTMVSVVDELQWLTQLLSRKSSEFS